MCRSKRSGMPGQGMARAFTLVELLVVITIIALLVTLLVPVASSAWQAAHMTRCKTNLFRIYQAQAQWRADNKGALLTGSRWMRFLWPYIEGDVSVFHCETRGAWGYGREAARERSERDKGSGGDAPDYWDDDTSPWEQGTGGNLWDRTPEDPDAIFEFDIYLQTGAAGPDDTKCGYTGIRGSYSHTIPLGDHPWVERIDYGSHQKYRVDDTGGSGITTKDDIELDVYYNANGDPSRVDINQASGYNTHSIQKRFIVDFKICGEVVVVDWAGRELGNKPHYGEAILIEYEEDDSVVDPGSDSEGGWVSTEGQARGIRVENDRVVITGGLRRYYGDYAISYGTYARRDDSPVVGVDGKLFYVLDFGGWDPVAKFNPNAKEDDEWDKYFIWSPRGQADAIAEWQRRFVNEANDWKAWQALRHFEKANVLFCDGHIESLGPQELDYNDPRWIYQGR